MRYLLLLALVIFCSACRPEAKKVVEQVIEEVHDFDPAGTLHIKNEDGAIHLFGSNDAKLHFKAIKRAYRADRLDALKVRVSGDAQSVLIETISPPKKKWDLRDRSGTVDYVVLVPKNLRAAELQLVNGEITVNGLTGGSVRAHVVNGRMSAQNCFGNLTFHAENGSIDFYYDWWEESNHTVEAAVPNGSLGVFLPPLASFSLQAETKGGWVVSNFIEGDEEERGHRKTVTAKFGSADGPKFQLKSGNGNIRVHSY